MSLELLSVQVERLRTRENPDGDIALPSWVDALLLGLHALVQSTAKPPATPASVATAGPAGGSPSGSAATASTPSGAPTAAAGEAPAAATPSGAQPTAGGDGDAAPTSAGPASAAGPAEGSTAQPTADASANGPGASAASQQGNLFESMRTSLVQTLEEQYRPGGLLSPEQQDQAAMVSAFIAGIWLR